MSTIEEKASMTDTIAIEKNGEAVNPQEQEQEQEQSKLSRLLIMTKVNKKNGRLSIYLLMLF